MAQPTSGSLTVQILEARLERSTSTFSKMDPYIMIETRMQRVRTATQENAGKEVCFPDESIVIDVKYVGDDLHLAVMDECIGSDDTVGEATIKLASMCYGEGLDEWYAIQHKGKPAGNVRLASTWEPTGSDLEEKPEEEPEAPPELTFTSGDPAPQVEIPPFYKRPVVYATPMQQPWYPTAGATNPWQFHTPGGPMMPAGQPFNPMQMQQMYQQMPMQGFHGQMMGGMGGMQGGMMGGMQGGMMGGMQGGMMGGMQGGMMGGMQGGMGGMQGGMMGGMQGGMMGGMQGGMGGMQGGMMGGMQGGMMGGMGGMQGGMMGGMGGMQGGMHPGMQGGMHPGMQGGHPGMMQQQQMMGGHGMMGGPPMGGHPHMMGAAAMHCPTCNAPLHRDEAEGDSESDEDAERITCNTCNRDVTKVLTCRPCDFDICRRCVKQRGGLC